MGMLFHDLPPFYCGVVLEDVSIALLQRLGFCFEHHFQCLDCSFDLALTKRADELVFGPRILWWPSRMKNPSADLACSSNSLVVLAAP